MNVVRARTPVVPAATLAVALIVVLAIVLAAFFVVPAARAAPANSAVTTASGNTEQWAFGGNASASYSCSDASCDGGVPVVGTLGISFSYYFAWVVIYTQTNVSATQTMDEAQTAFNASLKETVIENATTVNIDLAGLETASGFTNVTSAGTVTETSPGSSTLSALAVMNAASNEAFNFSGSVSLTNSSNASQDGSVNFDVGANEVSSISFASPLGLVPIAPVPGETWTASSSYSATGSWTTGYQYSGTFNGQSETFANWTNGVVSPSSTLTENGDDLGEINLTDNYTSPPTQVTAQVIFLDFSDGLFGCADGWLFVPVGVYGAFGGLSDLLHPASGVSPLAAGPAQSGLGSIASAETAYYQQGSGFVGASAAGNATGETSGSGLTSPSVSINAGPEPVGVAQTQYSGITSSAPSSGGSSSFPWALVVVLVVVVIVVVVVLLMVMRRRRHPPTAAAQPMMAYPAPPSAGGPTGPAPPSAAPVAAAPMAAAPAATAPPMPAAPPACPVCGQPTTYIAQYGRYYCYRDQRYA